ncbi:hypothetical protein BH10CYA1_BH10CYA1_34980 [soil metagenome]
MADEIDTLPLDRIVRQFEQRISERSLIELEQTFGATSPEVAMLLSDLIKKLSAQRGNEKFVELLQQRVDRIKQFWKNCDTRE